MTDATPAPATLPTKNALESVSVWASIATFVLGVLVSLGVINAETASVLGSNANAIIGAILTLISAIGGIGALRRKTLLRF